MLQCLFDEDAMHTDGIQAFAVIKMMKDPLVSEMLHYDLQISSRILLVSGIV